MFVSFHTHTLKRTGADILFFSLYRQRRLSVLLSISNFNFFLSLSLSLSFLLFISMFLSFCHCLFFSSPPHIFFPFSLYSVCVRVFKTMILFFRDRLFRKHRSRTRVSSFYLLRRVRALFEMFGC